MVFFGTGLGGLGGEILLASETKVCERVECSLFWGGGGTNGMEEKREKETAFLWFGGGERRERRGRDGFLGTGCASKDGDI